MGIDTKRMLEKSKQYSIDLTQEMLDQLAIYAKLLQEWNKKMNLTAIVEPNAIEDRHFIDSLLLAKQDDINGSIIDVGTGAGFPGIVLKIYRPDLNLTLLEPTGKRVRFLETVIAEIGLNLEIINDRAELVGKNHLREKFDVATARAVAGLPVLLEYCLPLVKVGGAMVAMKGEAAEQELKMAMNSLEVLGGSFVQTKQYKLPDGSERSLVYFLKQKMTPKKYPRNSGRITKNPL